MAELFTGDEEKSKKEILKNYFSKIFSFVKKDRGVLDKDLEEFFDVRKELKQKISLRRDKRNRLLDEREELFDKLVEADDEFLEKELGEEIYSIENEINNLQDEHRTLLDGLKVVNTAIDLKRKQQILEKNGLLDKIGSLDEEEFLNIFKRSDVREMVENGEWESLGAILNENLFMKFGRDERVNEIIETARRNRE